MGWVSGADVSTGDLITAAQWNNYLGASGSLEYLKTEVDRIDDATQLTQADFDPDRDWDTVYQNTGSGFRLVCITVDSEVDSYDQGDILIENATPPTIIAGEWAVSDETDHNRYAMLTFLVPPGWYYKIIKHYATATIEDWTEWNLH